MVGQTCYGAMERRNGMMEETKKRHNIYSNGVGMNLPQSPSRVYNSIAQSPNSITNDTKQPNEAIQRLSNRADMAEGSEYVPPLVFSSTHNRFAVSCDEKRVTQRNFVG
eukprot:scaffold9946_cov188-Amphora_coffeaeformis.AAC.6